jgi:glycosyltransferase involved in cell wall biosynthesis
MDNLAVLASRVSPKPIHIRLHRGEIDTGMFKKINWNNVKSLICVSKAYRNYVKEKISILDISVPIHVIYNGVDTEVFSYKEKLNTPYRLCTLGNLDYRKRVFDLIINNPDLQIDVGGDGIERRVLEDVIERFNLKAKLFGKVELPKFYHQHDVFMSNSEDEGFCVALIEAMSCGLIPLVFDWKSAREAVPPKYIYRDYGEMRKKLERVLHLSKEKILEEKETIRRIVEDKFNVKDQASNFLNILERTH